MENVDKTQDPEEVVIINGVSYPKSSNKIAIDYFSGEYILIHASNIYSFYTVGEVIINTSNVLVNVKSTISYTTSKKFMELERIVIQISSTKRYFKEFYIKKENLESFLKKYEFQYGKNLEEVLFHKSCLNLDQREPDYFHNIGLKYSFPRNLEGYIGSLNTNTKEYKELLPKILQNQENLGITSKTSLAFEGLPYTFGIELETVSGTFANYTNVFKNLNVASVFDGSLRDPDGTGPWGAEYVTGILKGDSGLKHVNEILKVLNTKCTVDNRTAFHVHIGSLKWNSQDILLAYILGTMIESEVFTLFPKSRKESAYCQSLKPLSSSRLKKLANNKSLSKQNYNKLVKQLYNQLFNIVGLKGAPGKNYNKFTKHPKGTHGGYDKITDHRYSWLNFTNIIFNQRNTLENKTIEFRCHSGTLSYTKIHNWIKFCMAFVEYVNSCKQDILNALAGGTPITINEIISKIYPKTGYKLMDYLETRKTVFNLNVDDQYDYKLEQNNINTLKDILCV